MRLNEFASAADTMALWKMISDNTWAAVAQQAEAEAKQKAERAAARKSASKRGAGKSADKPMPPKRLPPPLQHVTAPMPKADEKTSANKPQTHNAQPPNAQQAQPTAKPALSTAAPAANTARSATAAVPQGVGAARAAAVQPALSAPLQQPHATQQPLTPQQMRLQRQNVGNLAKNSAVTRRM